MSQNPTPNTRCKDDNETARGRN